MYTHPDHHDHPNIHRVHFESHGFPINQTHIVHVGSTTLTIRQTVLPRASDLFHQFDQRFFFFQCPLSIPCLNLQPSICAYDLLEDIELTLPTIVR